MEFDFGRFLFLLAYLFLASSTQPMNLDIIWTLFDCIPTCLLCLSLFSYIFSPVLSNANHTNSTCTRLINNFHYFKYTCSNHQQVSFLTSTVCFPVGFFYHESALGFSYVTLQSTTCYSLIHVSSVCTSINVWKHMTSYDQNGCCQINWFHLVANIRLQWEFDLLKEFNSIDTIFTVS